MFHALELSRKKVEAELSTKSLPLIVEKVFLESRRVFQK